MSEYALVGARFAAGALATLLGHEGRVAEPRCERVDMNTLPDRVFGRDGGALGVFVDLVGAVTGEAGIALPTAAACKVAKQLAPDSDVTGFDTRAQSVMSEIGNIMLSAASGAIAEVVGGVVIPSVPRLGSNIADVLLVDEICPDIKGLPAYLAECELGEGDEALSLMFVWIPGD